MGRIKVGAALATVVAIACAAQGLAAPGGALKHVNTVETLALRNAEGVAFAPNGKHVYGVGFAADGVAAFSRNANSGKLKLVDTESGNGLLGPTGVTVSPDNKTVYVTGSLSDSVHAYARAANGELTHIDSKFDIVDGDGLDNAHDVVAAPSGKHVYVTGMNDNAIAVFDRNASGELDWKTAVTNPQMSGPHAADISADGKHLYVTAGSKVVVFKRAKKTGQLNFVSAHDGPLFIRDVAVSADGKRVYTAADEGVRSYKRNPRTGKLTNPKVTDAGEVARVAVAPAHDAVYATVGNGVRTLKVGKNGKLKEIDFDQFGEVSLTDGVAVSGDGRHVVMAGGVVTGYAVSLSRQPTLTLKGKAKQAAGKLAVRAACTAKCRVTVSGKGLKKVSKNLQPGKAKKIALKFKGNPPSGGKLVIKGKAKAGNRKAADKVTVRLK